MVGNWGTTHLLTFSRIMCIFLNIEREREYIAYVYTHVGEA